MKTKTILVAASAAMLALTIARAADITPAETKAIAEEGFIYGLPIVMNYGVMYEFAVDTNSSQYKAPFNKIDNDAPRRDLRRHGRRHAEQRHALFDRLGWTCARSRW